MDRKNLVGPSTPTVVGNAVVWDATDGAIVRDSGVPLGTPGPVGPSLAAGVNLELHNVCGSAGWLNGTL